METIKLKLTFEDTFSKAKQIKFCSVNKQDLDRIKKSVGSITSILDNGIKWNFELIKIEEI